MARGIDRQNRIETARLVLQPCRDADRERIADMLQNEEITATFMVPEYGTVEEYLHLAQLLIDFSQPGDRGHYLCGIYLEDEIIGFVDDCGFDDDEIEVGYVIDPAYKGKGYATEALKAVITDLRRMGFKKMKAGFFEENTASRRVMERCGMHLNGDCDEEDYKGRIHRCLNCEIDLTVRDLVYTDRLMIRSIVEEDWESVLEMNREFAASEYFYLDKPKDQNPEGVAEMIKRWAKATATGLEHMFYAICLENRMIGFVSMNKRERGYECGYHFLEAFRGQGYATEGLGAVMDIVKSLGAEIIEAGTGLPNHASVALLKRLGFTMIGTEEIAFHKDAEGRDITFTGGVFVREL